MNGRDLNYSRVFPGARYERYKLKNNLNTVGYVRSQYGIHDDTGYSGNRLGNQEVTLVHPRLKPSVDKRQTIPFTEIGATAGFPWTA